MFSCSTIKHATCTSFKILSLYGLTVNLGLFYILLNKFRITKISVSDITGENYIDSSFIRFIDSSFIIFVFRLE